MTVQDGNKQTKIHLIRNVFFFIALLFGTIVLSAYLYSLQLNLPPMNFPVDADIAIEEGSTVSSVAVGLLNAEVVRSAFYLYILLSLNGKESLIQAGTYRFPTPLTSREVMSAITKGTFQSPLKRVTFPEGFTVKEFYSYLNNSSEKFSIENLLPYEGYLFPDTYFISEKATLENVRIMMEDNFSKKIAPLNETIIASGMTEKEVIILASIIEREAKDDSSRRMVSGILQNRLKINMPLQVDATFDYILGKESNELTDEDLKIDSPFNTYTHVGLPPAPIANPGLDAINAVLYPTKTESLYYLTAPDGAFYYAKTFEEHKRNKARYLR